MDGLPDTSTSDKRGLGLSALLGVVALAFLFQLADHVTWSGTDATEAVVFVLHRIALVLTGWVVLSAIVVAWAITGSPGSRFARSLAIFAVPWLRKVAIAGLAGGFVISGVVTPVRVIATDEDPRPVPRVIEVPQPIQDVFDRELVENPEQQPSPVTLRRERNNDTSERSPAKPKQVDNTILVRAGDNLWEIAERQVRRVTDDAPTNTEIAEYWSRLIAANRDSLTSGKPDLIYPGETIHLPPLREPRT